MRSASYRFNIANVPKIATVARAHCPKRPWTLDGLSALFSQPFSVSAFLRAILLGPVSLARDSLAQ